MKKLFYFLLFLFPKKKDSFSIYISELNRKYKGTGIQFDSYGNPVWESD